MKKSNQLRKISDKKILSEICEQISRFNNKEANNPIKMKSKYLNYNTTK